MMFKPTLIMLLIYLLTISKLHAEQMVFTTLKGMSVAEVCSTVLTEAYTILGIDIKIHSFPPQRAINTSNRGLVDGEVMRIKNTDKTYKNLIRIDPSICVMHSRVYTMKSHIVLTGWSSLRPYKIGIHLGHLYAKRGTSGMNVETIGTNEQLLEMLHEGRLDVVVAQEPDARKIIKDLGLKGINELSPPIASLPLYHYLHKKNADIIDRLEAVLSKMHTEGRIEEIYKSYLLGIQ